MAPLSPLTLVWAASERKTISGAKVWTQSGSPSLSAESSDLGCGGGDGPGE